MEVLERWHRMLEQRDMSALEDILADDCVFFSPIVHTPQRGKDLTSLYLRGAAAIFNDSFHYVKEVADERHAVLEFVCDLDGITVNGVDIMTFDDSGRIVEFKVMVRPLKAIHLVHERMRAMLTKLAGE